MCCDSSSRPHDAAAAYLTGYRVAGSGFTDDAIRSNLEEAIRASCKVEKRSELDALFTLSALEPEHANRRLGVGAALDDLGRGSEALEEWFHAVRLRHATLQQQHMARTNCKREQKRTTRASQRDNDRS